MICEVDDVCTQRHGFDTMRDMNECDLNRVFLVFTRRAQVK